MRTSDIGIVCFEFEHHENVETRRFAHGLAARGNNVLNEPVTHRSLGPEAISRLVAQQPQVIHLHVRYPFCTVMDLALATYARQLGFGGVITCSGSESVLNDEWILNKVPAIDGVAVGCVDFVLHQLLGRLRAGSGVEAVPGLRSRVRRTTVESSRHDEIAWRVMRETTPQLMGIPIAGVCASEGCTFRCDYCVHAAVALQRETREEFANVRCGQHRRPVNDLVLEMAELYHGHYVRYFYFSDENPLPATEAAALNWISELKSAFLKNGMKHLSLGMNTRAERLTPRIISEMQGLGLIRTLMGVEAGTERALRQLGRGGNAQKGIDALRTMADAGILVWFNSLFLHPQSDASSVGEELTFLKSVPKALFNTLKLRPFSGTSVTSRLREMNLLRGNPLLYDFKFTDESMVRFSRALTSFQINTLGPYDPALRLHDLLLNAKLSARHAHSRRARQMAARTEHHLWKIVPDINAQRVVILQALLAACVTGEDCADIQLFAQGKFAQLQEDIARQERVLERIAGAPIGRPYAQIAAAAALLVSLAGPVACDDVADSSTGLETNTDDRGTTDDSDTQDVETEDSFSDAEDGDSGTAQAKDSGSENDEDTASDDKTPDTASECAALELQAIHDYYSPPNDCSQTSGYSDSQLWVDESGKVTKIRMCFPGELDDDAVQQLEDCYIEMFRDEVFSCLDDEWVLSCPIVIE
ncbi:MAG: radical SAM protein [Deltaproteobacteria bacterium]|nr:radical SAM protein [Deltaproteobacteria bacterium]